MRTLRRRAFRRGMPKRLRAKLKRARKRRLGLTRRDLGAIGSGKVALQELLARLEERDAS